MIVSMHKYSFLVHHREYQPFLERLGNLGVLHVHQKGELESEDLLVLQESLKRVRAAQKLLEKREVEEQDPQPSKRSGVELATEIHELEEETEHCLQQIHLLEKELADWKPWGDFSLDALQKMREAGWDIHFLITPERKFYEPWKEQYFLEVIAREAPYIYFVIFTKRDEELQVGAEELPFPQRDSAMLKAALEEKRNRLKVIERELDLFARSYKDVLKEAEDSLEESLRRDMILEQTLSVAKDQVRVLEGFVPQPEVGKVEAACDEAGVLYLSERPSPEDKPPVLLKNNRYTRLFEPIGSLFSLPSYAELDLTPFFAPFFMMFFGFCLGDAGYGLFVLLAATIYKRRASKSLKPVITLAQYLGLATTFFGALTGTFFGMNLLEPEYNWMGNFQRLMLDSNQTFNLALILGLVQIIFGLFIQAANRTKQYGFAYSIPVYGWVLLLLSLLDIGLLEMTGPVSTYTAWGGVALIVLFSDPKAGLFGRIGKGLWDLYGITGFFGDLLSYIRLFALGISSAILGFVINDIAIQIYGAAPVIGPILFVVFLIIGHTANLLISSLGAFVHPLRLTFVEFYKNAGFEGGGKPYNPFRVRQKHNNQQKTV